MDIIVRRAQKEDARDLSELFVAFIGTESNIEKVQEQLDLINEQSNYWVAVACIDEKVIGTAMGIVCPDIVGECLPYLLVENVVVSPLHQGQGIGTKLMNALEEFAKKNQCAYVILASSETREQAHRFYESIGYQGNKRGFVKRL
ncbi:GNAT family N-acetyltransferase [Paenibacillus sp. PR3]|uniref:GNAT family N-acetyltransferase n=1 Tax=Paenibacillus terricola TaxID=2763503 RepID=A0ABR8N017_9BACL|nr:GNAT family N-acetyltransferase [Paenibacillus terricola]MBD3921537.1 GNAT family N-acetyltransferase [Paenibacillus terricola]